MRSEAIPRKGTYCHIFSFYRAGKGIVLGKKQQEKNQRMPAWSGREAPFSFSELHSKS